MATQHKETAIKLGPSREELFDYLKYWQEHAGFHVVQFYTEEVTPSSKSSTLIRVRLEGIHVAGDSGREWFIFGRLKNIGSGSTWKPAHEAPDGLFVFARWNTYHRRGKIIFSEKSFFVSPLSKGLAPQDPEDETVEDRKNAEAQIR